MSTDGFPVPGIPKEQFHMRFGESVLSEFVKSHDYASLIDELIQNDYDAESPRSRIELFEDKLVSTGFGRPIDEAGWQRLKLVMGTSKYVPPKKSRLGIKNQGLRALFLLGDFIFVRSNGDFTVLSLEHGSLKKRRKDNATRGRAGTTIEVPYRLTEANGLPVFSVEKERRLIQELETNLPLKVGMLSTPQYRHIMNKVTIAARRTGIRLVCKQEILNIDMSTPSKIDLQRRIILETRRIASGGH